jgi:hypothetical protein
MMHRRRRRPQRTTAGRFFRRIARVVSRTIANPHRRTVTVIAAQALLGTYSGYCSLFALHSAVVRASIEAPDPHPERPRCALDTALHSRPRLFAIFKSGNLGNVLAKGRGDLKRWSNSKWDRQPSADDFSRVLQSGKASTRQPNENAYAARHSRD